MPVSTSPSQSMNSGVFCDLKLLSRGKEFAVHKAVICSHSPVMKALLSKPSQEPLIDMSDFQPDAVRRLVQFIYTGDYHVPNAVSAEVDAEENGETCSVALLAAAHR
ncbi:speckle-type POZ protein-like protein [Ophiocordyceps camponoti-floridani]|uniref:Speckle-type POZ protein-like protein n=1 Tax=Ophiocordyceps camponoti-floridani TaxID=2030778 RepID=A0A8H4VBL6_9HYPO|nr:speckle-type POZ protein-like protein [Ophiocordyceps camponoti-floridani]